MITSNESAVRFCESMGMKLESVGLTMSEEVLVAFVIGMVFAWVMGKVFR